MEWNFLSTRRVIAAGCVATSVIIAGSTTADAEWPRLWGRSKPKVTVASAESRRAAPNRLETAETTVAQKAAYEEDLAIPKAARSAESAEPRELESDDLSLDGLIAVALAQNPRLAKVSFAVEAARGRAHQAGLYPNPTVALLWDELFDKTGRSGVNQLPGVTQEIVMAGKLKLSRAAGEREAEQASWSVMAERYAVLAEVRTAYFDALTLQERVRLLDEIRRYGQEVTKTVRSLRDDAKQLADIDVLPVEAELARYEADLESALQEYNSTYKRLSAVLGVNRLLITSVPGYSYQVQEKKRDGTDENVFHFYRRGSAPKQQRRIDTEQQKQDRFVLPDYDAQATTTYVLSVHPEIQVAQWGVEKAKLVVQRARVEPIPNLGIDTGYVRQNQNRSDDFRIGVSASIPLWNKNQGNIRAAEAELCAAMQEVGRVENSLADRVAAAIREYAAARKRFEKYQAVVDRAEQAQNIATEDQRRNLSPLMVLELQRSLRQARLERLKALGDAWKAAATISGLTIEDQWPPAPANPANVPPAPAAEPPKP